MSGPGDFSPPNCFCTKCFLSQRKIGWSTFPDRICSLVCVLHRHSNNFFTLAFPSNWRSRPFIHHQVPYTMQNKYRYKLVIWACFMNLYAAGDPELVIGRWSDCCPARLLLMTLISLAIQDFKQGIFSSLLGDARDHLHGKQAEPVYTSPEASWAAASLNTPKWLSLAGPICADLSHL